MTEAHHLCACGARYDQHTVPYWNDEFAWACGTGEPTSYGTEGAKCLRFTLATAPLPAGCAPDPLDQAAVRVAPDATAAAAGVDSHMVRLSDAKRIRDAAARANEDRYFRLLGEVARAHGALLKRLPNADSMGRPLDEQIAVACEHAFTQGSVHSLAQLPPEAADLLDEIAGAVELEPVEHIGELQAPGFDPVACIHDLINTAALAWMTDEADTRSWADVALDVLNDGSNWDVVRLYLAEAGLIPGSVR